MWIPLRVLWLPYPPKLKIPTSGAHHYPLLHLQVTPISTPLSDMHGAFSAYSHRPCLPLYSLRGLSFASSHISASTLAQLRGRSHPGNLPDPCFQRRNFKKGTKNPPMTASQPQRNTSIWCFSHEKTGNGECCSVSTERKFSFSTTEYDMKYDLYG